jgi:DNA-binding XRE family transcriptional regulator
MYAAPPRKEQPLSTYRFDMQRFVKDVLAYQKRRKITQAKFAREVGVSSSTIGNMARIKMPEIDIAASICKAMGHDINRYFVKGLPKGIHERWIAAHEDGRVVTLERRALNVVFEEVDANGEVVGKGTKRYGNGLQPFNALVANFIEAGYVEKERLTA